MYGLPGWLKPDEKYFGPYFKTDEKGREVYYPWGYPGEAYYVNEKQKKELKHSFWLFGLTCLICAFVFTAMVMPIYSIVIISIHSGYLIWIIFLYFYSKRLEPLKYQSLNFEEKSTNPKLLKDLVSSLIFYLFLVLLGLLNLPDDVSLALCGVFLIVFYPVSIWFVWHRKGYIFQEKPSSA